MIPSNAATISGSASTASGFSIFAMSGSCAPHSFMIARAASASVGRRTKDSAIMSAPRPIAQRRSAWSFWVSGGALTATPGRLMPLWSEIIPPTSTVVVTREPFTPVAWSMTRPSSIRRRSPGRTSPARPA